MMKTTFAVLLLVGLATCVMSVPLADEATGDSFNLDFLSRPVEGEASPMEDTQETVFIQSCDTAQFIGGSAKARADTLKVHQGLCNKIIQTFHRVGNTKSYVTWFGAFSISNQNHVKNTYIKIHSKLTFYPVTYNFNADKSKCSNGELLAYTSYGSNTIFLCDGFVSAKNPCTKDATKSKEHELIRTWSIAAADTKGYSTGQDPTKDLAKKDPSKAVDNAESYAYFYCRP
ncbi:PREDICTED: peptidyl-Lys metalloendopeptidase-like isoform X2 [Amphimedon queenslandica]|uniref:Lysine-specific metallo-endopeptidase domain-containing protein n=1 Tax=Amphimedon queenslandica TaxID=400682 RepID=A0A1X7UG95_AMPQE|nr:PREDICTED: peptidyl-Lys metalloendopeptidase-like isoform X2 [Amphimedon queenslandica]|eukprot:XP_019854273.1 PREDICTED: peptidyl-Lys metalloendopeptidase-like isoform X2 [Amphimedon queenslandica]